MFWNSMSQPEKEHIIEAFSFELGKVKNKSVQQQVVDMFANVSLEFTTAFAEAIGAVPPQNGGSEVNKASEALSMLNTKKLPNTRKVGVLIGSDFDGPVVMGVLAAMKAEGIQAEVISEKLGVVKGTDRIELPVDHTFLTTDSVLFDAIYAAGGIFVKNKSNKDMTRFINEAFMHFKPIGASRDGQPWLGTEFMGSPGVVIGEDIDDFVTQFVEAISAHRHWDRQIG
jgi:catalase